MQPEIVWPLLRALGDARLIKAFSVCFGKQAYSNFQEEAKRAVFVPASRYLEGYNPKLVPPDDAFTVMDVLKLLSSDDETRILLDHPAFKYSRISRKRVDADENLSADEQDQLEALRAKMADERSAKVLKGIQDEINALLASKKDALKFVADPAPEGCPIANLVYNESRPNVSVLVRKTGHVDLNDRAYKQLNGQVPFLLKFPTFIWRNYAIIKDGLVNVELLPVQVSQATYNELLKHNVDLSLSQLVNADAAISTALRTVINFKPLPILNRKMVKSVSAQELVRREYMLLTYRADQKVYKHYLNALFPDAKLEGFAEKYGPEAAAWLKEQGITEFNGFSPKQVQAESTDVYMGKELNVKIKGFSSLPKVDDVKDKLDKVKPGTPAMLMADAIQRCEAASKNRTLPLYKLWLETHGTATTHLMRRESYQVAQIKTSVIVGQTWFNDLAADVITFDVKVDDDIKVTATLELREIEIKI